ncbi:hypothetical protein THASP1DRAFT_26686 [Thamnocephalis sphaerospora]|uniref:Uncharacterized protein n=1 Tax=Thamnocephalis sphaerospora TaxID=78915 RepID=A0A4P9XGI1_9FUNG|nr:hypothetical protein THASP1DRAFT_26686 [Thamnocephalis sphaerospora]|eukprot:RKP04722.1 hypothetical protein THASP1DRAFT_26686 [Thamnocephalis sphaerospora]
MTWSISDVIKLNRTRSKKDSGLGEDSAEEEPVEPMERVSSLPSAASARAEVAASGTGGGVAEKPVESRKSTSKSRPNPSATMTIDDFPFMSGGMGGNGVPIATKFSSRSKASVVSLPASIDRPPSANSFAAVPAAASNASTVNAASPKGAFMLVACRPLSVLPAHADWHMARQRHHIQCKCTS